MSQSLKIFRVAVMAATELKRGRERQAALDAAFASHFARTYRDQLRHCGEGWLHRDGEGAWLATGGSEVAKHTVRSLLCDVSQLAIAFQGEALEDGGRYHPTRFRRSMTKAANVVGNWQTQAVHPRRLQALLLAAAPLMDAGPLFSRAVDQRGR